MADMTTSLRINYFTKASVEYAKVIKKYKDEGTPVPAEILKSIAYADLNASKFEIAVKKRLTLH